VVVEADSSVFASLGKRVRGSGTFFIFSEARMIRTFRSKRKFFTSRLLEDYI